MEPLTTTVTVDARGRVVIPQAVRDTLEIDGGETLTLEVAVVGRDGDG
jgi:AbrB family looped-hinge helix DNA binding protein